MVWPLKNILFFALAVLLLSASCAKKSSCPIYWEQEGGNPNVDGTEAGKTAAQFPMARVKRDKNGIVTKKTMARNKVKRTDPRKEYKGN